MKQFDTTAARLATIDYWAAFTHPSNQRDIDRVYAFRDLDRNTATDAQVTQAYGGPGWVPVPMCAECGGRDDGVIVFGANVAALCPTCVSAAAELIAPAKKPGLFSRFRGA